MKNKKVIIILIILALLISTISIFIYKNNQEKNASYKIVVSLIEKNSPDYKLSVLRNNKEIKFDSVYYLDDVLLCKGTNPTINKFDVEDGEELKIKLKNKKIVKANVVKELK